MELLLELKVLGILSQKTYLFTTNTNSLYTILDTTHTLHVIETRLDGIDLPEGFSLGAV